MKYSLVPLLISLFLFGAGCTKKQDKSQMPAESHSESQLPERPLIHEHGYYQLQSLDARFPYTLTIVKYANAVSGTYLDTSTKEKGRIASNDSSTTSTLTYLYTSRDKDTGTLTLYWPTSPSSTLQATWVKHGETEKQAIRLITTPTQHPLTVQYTHQTYTHPKTQEERCTFKEGYLVFDESHPQAKALNDAIERKIAGVYSATATVPLLEQRAARYIADCIDELSAFEEAEEDLPVSFTYTDEQYALPMLMTTSVVSMLIDGYSYTGGAHPNPYLKGISLDLETGKILTLKDLIKEEHLFDIIKLEQKKLLSSEYAEGLYEEVKARYEQDQALSTMSTEQQLAQYGNETQFYLTEDGIVLYHGVYDIAPYVVGSIETLLPYSEIASMMNPSGSLASFLSK